ncbi:GNAT family N-acetyltransferase [Aestuariibius sp. 2305UL40-4]|uniref:GNAT family N-acetyltransferase n=1 Tax=Aestuariibius violaceus TaxID=3234132 RepID=UPI00345E075F
MTPSADLTLRAARPSDLAALTDLCLRSKAHWGYDDAFMTACRDELTVTEADLPGITLLENGASPIAMVQLTLDGDTADLARLYVAPEAMGQGAGRRLLDHAITQARRSGAHTLTIEADPNAAPFYERLGARQTGEVPSGSIPGRKLPRLELPLTP